MKRACVLGHFGFGENLLNGQTIKTKIVTDELERRLPDEVVKMDTHGGWKTLLKAPFQVLKALKTSANVIIFPAHNGLRIYAPLLCMARRFFRRRKLHYAVIGGWLASYLSSKKLLTKTLKSFDAIYVETSTMKRALEELGFDNIVIMPNCKKLLPISSEELVYPTEEPYKLCTFSRVMKEKGIEDAIEAVKAVNGRAGRTAYTLDIYGQIDPAQTQWFEELKTGFPLYVRYGGLVPFDKSVEVLKEYYLLLFPTRFFTEGIPGTIIDAYAAGVPVVSARWESFGDIIDDDLTGLGYEFNNTAELTEILHKCCLAPRIALDLKEKCLMKSREFSPESVVGIMIDNLGDI